MFSGRHGLSKFPVHIPGIIDFKGPSVYLVDMVSNNYEPLFICATVQGVASSGLWSLTGIKPTTQDLCPFAGKAIRGNSMGMMTASVIDSYQTAESETVHERKYFRKD